MHDKHLYEYAVVRYVPRIEREEFINVGLIMMCKRKRWIKIAIEPDFKKINAMGACHSEDDIANQLSGLKLVAEGNRSGGKIAELDVTERFRWLSAVRSACIQTARPHPGICDNLDETFDCLVNELVR